MGNPSRFLTRLCSKTGANRSSTLHSILSTSFLHLFAVHETMNIDHWSMAWMREVFLPMYGFVQSLNVAVRRLGIPDQTDSSTANYTNIFKKFSSMWIVLQWFWEVVVFGWGIFCCDLSSLCKRLPAECCFSVSLTYVLKLAGYAWAYFAFPSCCLLQTFKFPAVRKHKVVDLSQYFAELTLSHSYLVFESWKMLKAVALLDRTSAKQPEKILS